MAKGKKSVDVPLKKSDRKKLLETVKHQCSEMLNNNDNDTTAALLHSIFIEGTLTTRKLQHPQLNKVVLYYRGPSENKSDDDSNKASSSCWPYTSTTQCVWMTVDQGPSEPLIHVPTVALLSVLPINSFPTVVVPSSHVSKFVCRGAHLMKAGISQLMPATIITRRPKHGIVAIRVQGNEQPFAVGQLAHDFQTNPDSGVGVEIWNCYGDDFWKQQSHIKEDGIQNPIGGASFDNGNYGNVGFLDGKLVVPIVAVEEEEEEESAAVESSNEPTEASSEPLEQQGETPTDTNPTTDNVTTTADNHDDVNHNDTILHQAVCEALVNIKDSQLPMTSTNFYAQHVKPRAATPINIKLTSWKKFNTYLLEQVDSGLLTCKAHGTDPMGYLTGIDRRHEDLRGLKKDPAQPQTQSKKLAIVNLCVIPHHFINLLKLDLDACKAETAKSPERRGTSMLTMPEARAIVGEYLASNNLEISSTHIQLDPALTSALYKKHQGTIPEMLSKKDFYKVWLMKMEPAYALVEMPGNQIVKLGRGTPPQVSIEVSLRQGRKKYATRVRGLEDYGIDPVAFSKDVQRRFACACTVETEPEGRASLRKGYVELDFQGHLVEELKALLLGDEKLTSHGGAKDSEYCLPKSAIDVTLKKNVPSKKPKKR